jgi:hypothetical protein
LPPAELWHPGTHVDDRVARVPPAIHRRSHLTKTRRVLAIVCIAVVVVTALTPATANLLCAVLVALDPLFGTILTTLVAAPGDVDLGAAPFLSVRSARAPPIA